MLEELPQPDNPGLALAPLDEISALVYCVGVSVAARKVKIRNYSKEV